MTLSRFRDVARARASHGGMLTIVRMSFRGFLLALLAASACTADEPKPPCNPAEPGCVAQTSPGVAYDPRIVGPGMRGDALPHWPMFHHDPAHSGRNGIAAPSNGAVQWTFQTEGEIWSSPSVGLDGTIYVGSN